MQELCKSFLCNLKKPFLVFFLVLFFSSISFAGNDEIFVTGVLRNATNNSLIEDTLNIFINITNTSDGALVYSQTQNNIFIDDGVYHVTFNSITDPEWFLYPVNFTLKLGNAIFNSKEVVPVPVAHACFVANDSNYLGGTVASSYYETSDGTLGNTTTEIRSVFDNSSNITYDPSTGSFFYNGSVGSGTTYTGGANISTAGDVLSINKSFSEYMLNTGDNVTGNYTFDNNTLFIDSTINRVGIGQTTEFDTKIGLSVTGDIDITHVATESDDHALDIVIDAAGFGDVKGIDLDYVTGAISIGSEEDIILINIDESLATGGDIIGVEVLATEGSAEIYGFGAGVLVNPIVQFSGIFGDMDSANNSGADNLSNFISSADNHPIFVNDNDYVTIGDANKFEEIEFLLNVSASGAGIKPTFEFSTGIGTWTTFTPTDGTDGMKHTGLIEWFDSAIPTWNTGAGTEYLIRITRTANSLSTVPIENKVQISAVTIYKWNKDGDLVVNEINTSKVRSDDWTNVSITDSQISDLPTCVGGDFVTSDGTDFTCDTPVGGGGGAGDKWVDSGDFISPNTTFAKKVNATGYTADGGTNISKEDVNTTNLFAALIYRAGTELSNIYAAITYVDNRVDSIDNHTATGNETTRVDLIIGTYIPTNATADRAYTDTRVDSIDNHTATTDTNTQRKGDNIYLYNDSTTMILNGTKLNETANETIDDRVVLSFLQNLLDSVYATFGYVDNRVDSIDNHTATVDTNASTACSGTTTYLDGEGTCDDISSVYVQASDWTTHDDYATGCTNQFVTTIADTLTCASVDSADIGTVLLSDLTNDINAITNTSDGGLGLLNITTNITISNASNSAFKLGIWNNGSGICISAC